MKREDTINITARCFHGEPASCSHPCPFFFDIRTFLLRAATGKWGLAYKLFRNATVFPAVVCELCEAPCCAECQREDDAIDIRAVETAAVKYAKNKMPEAFRIEPKSQRIAVVGAGFAGLSLALNMAQKAFQVTVFERGSQELTTWSSHPKYENFLDEIHAQFSSVNVEFVYNYEVASIDDSAIEGFDAVYFTSTNIKMDSEQASSNPKYFFGGSLKGQNAVAAIAYGIDVSKEIEAWLNTGKRASFETEKPEKHRLDHKNEQKKPRVIAADPALGYTSEEAIAEASRCMGCDCRACMDSCVMLGHFNKRPQKIAIEAFSDTKTAPPVTSCTLTRETYSCNLCGHCKSICPVDIDMGELFHISRTWRAETGVHSKVFHDFWLSDFDWHRTEGEFFKPTDKSMLFFPGCKTGARSPSQARDIAGYMKDHYGAGVLLDCCGVPAYWAGEDELFHEHLKSLKSKWETACKPVFVFACVYCMRLFEEFLPEIEKISLYELLSNDEDLNAVVPCDVQTNTDFAVFDPCMARDYPEMEKAVRKLAEGIGTNIIELPDKNQCCGFGGHMRAANQDLYDIIVEERSGANDVPYLVYCANCAKTFSMAGKENTHILDLIFPMTNGDTDNIAAGSLQRWRNNAALTKTMIAELYGDMITEPDKKPWDILNIEITTSLAVDIDRRLILEDNIREAIYKAESNDEYFVCEEKIATGSVFRTCRLVKNVVTIWVQYIKHEEKPNYYSVIDVWSHRMRYAEEG